uniref:AAA+ ATPase domain-containing protein n=1 Tax=Manihot esculenta TaxID=3983 RepID=A0A2C9WG31_MANES
MEFAKLVVDPIVSKVFELLVNPVVRQIKYVFNYSANIHNLEEEVEKLSHAKQRVEHTVEVARRNPLEQIEADVQQWLAKVDSVAEDADKILLQHKDGGKRRCFMGLCPNLIRRQQISRKASKEIPIIVGAREGGNFPRVSYRAPPQGIGAVKECEAFESRNSVVDEILNALKDADVNLIGVYGMGGVGKTTLVRHIATLVRELGIFKLVVIATVTHSVVLTSVQQEIAEWLDFKLGAESIAVRAARLSERIKKEEKILIILDDIWAAIKLDEIGIPYGTDHNGSKILMTSRNQSVLSEMGVQRDFRLEVLEHQEAWSLFEKKVGDLKDSNLRPIAVEIAKRCAGLPILIVAVATALKNKQAFEWNDALEKLKIFDGRGHEKRVYSALELSYNFLRDEEKSLFRLLGQLKANEGIRDLFKYVVGFGLFNQHMTLKATRNRLLTVISDLKLSCLLLEDGDHERVKMHDVVHSFAASFVSKHDQVLTAANEAELEEWPDEDFFKQCTSISLPYCKIPKLPEVFECPKLKSFFLFNQDCSLKITENLFSRMKELKVLDLTGIYLSPLPSSLQSLENLQTLCLDGCDLEDIAAIGELKQLQVLSLLESTIIRLPNEVRKLTCLRLLDLSRCQRLKVIPPNVLSTLAQLEELYLGGSLVQWEGEGHDEGSNNANLSELKLLSKLSTLEIHIIDANIMPKDIFSEKLERFRVFIGDGWDWANDEYETSRSLKLKLNRSALLERVKVLLMKTESLYLDDLKGVRSVLYELDDQGFPELKHLRVQNSLDIQYIIDWMKMNHFTAFPKLELLFLHNLNNLEKIYRGPYTVGSFSDLRKLKVENCNALRSLFSFSMFNVLKKLEEVNVNNCEIIQVIVAKEGEDDEECELTQLRSLTLENLPQFTSFCSQVKVHSISQRARNQEIATTASNEIVCEADAEVLVALFNDKIRFPNLADMNLVGINVEMIWPCQHKALSPSIEKLTTLIVDGCGNLNFLFTSSIVGSLAQLKVLEICDCKSMEEVILAAGEGETMSKILLPKLDSLKLKGLPKLVRFCTAKLIECPSLKVLKMGNCPRLQAFVSTQANTSLFDEKVWFPNLDELHVEDMHMLKMIWCDEVLADSFGRLKELKVLNGKQLLEIFPSKLLEKFLVNLEFLTVQHCDSVKEVFDLQAIIKEREVHVARHSQLRNLDIRNLPNLIQIWNRDPHGSLSFYNLHVVIAWDCPNLKKFFPFSVGQCLPHLELLTIGDCGMEEIVAKEERAEALAIIPKFAFRGLKAMVLLGLDELNYFYSGKHTLECPQLKYLNVHLCGKLQTFNFESQEMQEMLMDKQEDELKLQIPQPLFSFREVGFSGLQHLKLSEFSQLKEAWKTQLPLNFFHNLSSLEVDEVAFSSIAVPSNLLPILNDLEKLEVRNCDSVEQVFGLERPNFDGPFGNLFNLSELKLINLPMLRLVWIEIPKGILDLRNLKLLKIYNCSSLRYIFTPTICCGLEQLQVLEVKSCAVVEEIITEESTDEIRFPQLNSIILESLPRLINFSSGSGTVHCPSLKEIAVVDCPTTFTCSFFREADAAIDKIVERKVFFPNLKDLKLSSIDVEMMWHAQHLKMSSYTENLTSLTVDGCGNLKYLLSSSSIVHLKRLEVCNCKMMEQVILREGLDEEIMSLHQLESLKLKDLPKLTRFCTTNLVECSALKEICIQNCPQMRTFVSNSPTSNNELEIINSALFDEKVAFPNLEKMEILNMDYLNMLWHNQLHSDSFCKIKALTVEHCEELLKIFPSMLLRGLQNLEDLIIGNCDSLEEVFDLQEIIKLKETVTIQLRTLNIRNLPNLKHVWNKDPMGLVLFDNLSSVVVWDCPNLKAIFPATIAKNLLQLENLNVKGCGGVEEIVAQDQGTEASIEFLFPCLKFLILWELNELKCFYSRIHTLESPLLKCLIVYHCEKLNIFCPESENLPETDRESQAMIQDPQPLFSFRKV